MDYYLYAFLFLSSLLLLLLKLNRHGRGHAEYARLPPGPRKLPIIGNLLHLLGPLPHHSLAALSKQYGPVMLLKLGEVFTLVVSSPAAAAEIVKTQDVSFATRPVPLSIDIMTYGGKGFVFSAYGTFWRELRKMSILELLSAKRVQSFRSIREEEVLSLVRSIASSATAGSAVNVSEKLMQLTNDMTARALIGSKCAHQEEFLRTIRQVMEEAGGFNLVDLFPSSSIVRLLSSTSRKMEKLHWKMDGILDIIIEEHNERKAAAGDGEHEEQDVVDVLLRVQREGSLPFRLTDETVKTIVQELFGAGSETSSTSTEWIMSELMNNPTAMKKAQDEIRQVVGTKGRVTEDDISQMHYLKLVIKEAFRLHPPLPLLLPRECQDTREVLGYQIPPKTRVLINAWSLGRDPQCWGDDADEFRPERFSESSIDFKGTNFELLPFGAGRRMCPGMTFGLANIELPLTCLLYYFDWELPSSEKKSKLDMTESFLLTSCRKSKLLLRAIPYASLPLD